MQDFGKVVEVRIEVSGDETVGSHPIGATVLQLDDITDFSEKGGEVEIEGLVYPYNGIDDEFEKIILGIPLTVAVPDATKVNVWPFKQEKWATVDAENNDEPIEALIPHGLKDRVLDGIRDEEDEEYALLRLGESEWEVVDLLAERPDIDGTYLEPGTVSGESMWLGDQETVYGSMDDFGHSSWQVVNAEEVNVSEGGLYIGGRSYAEIERNTPRGLLFWADRAPLVTRITTEYGILGLDVDWPEEYDGARKARLRVSLGLSGTTSGVQSVVRVRRTTDGSQPTISSPEILDKRFTLGPADRVNDLEYSRIFAPTAGHHRYLLTVDAGDGSLNTEGAAALSLEDIGSASVMNAYKNTGGGSLGSGGSDSGTNPAREGRKIVKEFSASWARTYDESGAVAPAEGGLRQGYRSSVYGNEKSAIGFSAAVQAALADATVISKVEVYLYANYWTSYSGGTAVIGYHNAPSDVPTTWGDVIGKLVDQERSPRWARPGGRWVDITADGPTGWKTGSKKGILLGPGPSSSSTYYGVFDGPGGLRPPKLRITYRVP